MHQKSVKMRSGTLRAASWKQVGSVDDKSRAHRMFFSVFFCGKVRTNPEKSDILVPKVESMLRWGSGGRVDLACAGDGKRIFFICAASFAVSTFFCECFRAHKKVEACETAR